MIHLEKQKLWNLLQFLCVWYLNVLYDELTQNLVTRNYGHKKAFMFGCLDEFEMFLRFLTHYLSALFSKGDNSKSSYSPPVCNHWVQTLWCDIPNISITMLRINQFLLMNTSDLRHNFVDFRDWNKFCMTTHTRREFSPITQSDPYPI